MLYINGEWKTEGSKLEVINPATGEIIKFVTTGGKDETKEAISSATNAFKTWKDTPGIERSNYLRKVAQLIRSKSKELAEIITKENGKPLPEAGDEVKGAINHLEWYAEEAKRIYGDTLPVPHIDRHRIVLREPVGVSALITPWNYPLSMITRKMAPALAAGCTVVVKPSFKTPLSAIKVFECFHEAGVPAGVVNLIIGQPIEVVGEMTSNPHVRKLSFTGSTTVGRKLIKDTADTVKKVSMELGGHAPFIIFEDADIDKAVEGVLISKFKNCGQTCISSNRIYVSEKIVEEFSGKLVKEVAKLKIGNGLKEGIDIGPIIDKAAVKKIADHVDDAIKHRGEILYGGKVYEITGEKGSYFEPTIIQHATEEMKIATEETFGPVAPIFTFKTEEEVIEKANHKEYGLAAYCYTENINRGLRMMRSLEYGMIGINDPLPVAIEAPFGGIKQSGIGSENGRYGLEEYLEVKFVALH